MSYREINAVWSYIDVKHKLTLYGESVEFTRACVELRKVSIGHVVFSNLFEKNVLFVRYVKQCGGAREAGNDSTVWRMHFACRVTKATYASTCKRPRARTHTCTRARTHTHTHTQICNTYCFFHSNNGFPNAPRFYVIRTLPVLCKNNLLRNG